MLYNFNIPNNGNKKADRLFKRVGKISFMVNNGFFLFTGIAAINFVGIKLVNLFTSFHFLEGRNLIAIILSLCVSGFLTSLYNALLNEKGTYKKLCKTLGCSVFVNKMDMQLPKNDEDIKMIGDVSVPDLHIYYDVNGDEGNIAVLVKVGDGINKIIAIIDTKTKGRNKKFIVLSKDLAAGIEGACNEDDFLVLRTCQIKKECNGYVKDVDIDTRLIMEEAFMLIETKN